MPIRRLLERGFHEAGLAASAPGRNNIDLHNDVAPSDQSGFVAMLPVAVADFRTSQGWATKLALALSSRGEPYELVTQHGAPVSPGAQLLINALTRDRGTESAKQER